MFSFIRKVVRAFTAIGKFFAKIIKALWTALKFFPLVGKLFIFLFSAIKSPGDFLLIWVKLAIFWTLCVYNLIWTILRPAFIAVWLFLTSLLFLFCAICSFVITIFLSFWDCVVFRGWVYPVFYRFLGACENEPGSWLTNGSYHESNINEKKMGISFYKCGENYIPNNSMGGIICERSSSDQPTYIPPTNIQKLFRSKEIHGHIEPTPFVPDIDFMDQPLTVRKNIIAEKKKRNWHSNNVCEAYSPYSEPVSRLICKTSGVLTNNTTKMKMDDICYKTFCKNGKWDSFCHRVSEDTITNTTNMESIAETHEPVLPKYVFNVVFTIILLVMIDTILRRSKIQGKLLL
jgi:hypothetical protein